MKERIHKKLLDHCEELIQWYNQKIQHTNVPFYSSYDIRDAGFKIGNVDGNIFPAGFNNICQVDKEHAPDLMQGFLKSHFPKVKKILLLTEDHLKNAYYWENIITIKELLIEAGYQIDVGMLSAEINEGAELESYLGRRIFVERVFSKGAQLQTRLGAPDLVITNNDFSNPYPEIDFSQTLMTPLRELGWYQRKKYSYFENYNKYALEFAQIIDEDPWLFQVQTIQFDQFDVGDEASRELLAQKVDLMIADIEKKYKEHEIKGKPYVFVKNNSGTYGLGVVEVNSGEDVRSWNYKSKKKMKAAKGGGGFSEVIIQEGIPSVLKEDQATAEPVLYMVGGELVGGFLRTHEQKDSYQSLNSPGAVYKRLCLSDLKVGAEGCLLENVYGWVAKIGLLAISLEASQILRSSSGLPDDLN